MIRSATVFRIDRFAASPACRATLLPLAGIVSLAVAGLAAAADAPRKLPSAATSAVAARRTIVDPAVTPAGGGCRQCGPGGCRHGHGGHGHHAGCRDGHCVPHCPVRPDRFGFYDTQWRKWPGQGVVPASATDLATPAVPPKSALPGANEESFGPPDGDGVEPTPPGGNAAGRQDSPRAPAPEPVPRVPAPVPQEPEATAPAPPPQPEPPTAPEPEAAAPTVDPVPALPAAEPPATESPADAPSSPRVPEAPPAPPPAPEKSDDGDLFDEAAVGRARRVFIASRAGEVREAAAGVQQATHVRGAARPPVVGRSSTDTRNVPRVSFDPRAEAERLRAGR